LSTGPSEPRGYATFKVPVIDGWIVQCHETVCVRSRTIFSVEPAGRFVFELPSSSVKVCSVSSLFDTVSVTDPALRSTASGENAKFSATIDALVAPPPPPAGAGEVALLVLVVIDDELLVLVHAAVTRTTATSARTVP